MLSMRRNIVGFLVGLMVGAAVSAAEAQEPAPGVAKIEVGIIPIGGTFLLGGDGDEEVDFNVYTSGGTFAYYLTSRTAIEGELTISLGLAQDVYFHQAKVFHVQMPNVWTSFGNIVFYPRGSAGGRLPWYVSGGIGAMSLQSREPTKPFGYDVDVNGWETFMAENIGGGVKILRVSTPAWGFRADYRYLIVNADDDAPAFFARSKTRGGHRLYFGVLFRAKR